MAADAVRTYHRAIHPVHAVLLAGAIPLFLGALISDWAYSATYQVQWTHFASWLIAGALVFAGLALVWAIIDLLRRDTESRGLPLVYVLVLLATWVLGFINALVHAKDAWAAMPAGFILSVVVTLLAIVAVWLGFSTLRSGDLR